MDNLLISRKKNNALMRLRKDEMKYKLNAKKSDENNPETFNKLYEDYNKRRNDFSWGITKKSVEIISTKNLNIYSEYGKEDEKLNKNENIKKNEQYKNNKNNKYIINIIQSKNISKRNLQKIKKEKEKESRDNLLINNIDNLKKNDDNSENDFNE